MFNRIWITQNGGRARQVGGRFVFIWAPVGYKAGQLVPLDWMVVPRP